MATLYYSGYDFYWVFLWQLQCYDKRNDLVNVKEKQGGEGQYDRAQYEAHSQLQANEHKDEELQLFVPAVLVTSKLHRDCFSARFTSELYCLLHSLLERTRRPTLQNSHKTDTHTHTPTHHTERGDGGKRLMLERTRQKCSTSPLN